MFTQSFDELSIKTNGNKLIKITEKIINFVDRSKISSGILNISILHTSASLIIQENADDDVQKDILNFYDKLVPMRTYMFITQKERMICQLISNPL
jgi:secondary thiamine-phosphate synthase enzyme